MADFDPYAAMAMNPYMQQAPQKPDWMSFLGNALMGVGAGIGQADASGRGWSSGIGPGLMYANQAQAQQQQQAQQEQQRRLMFGLQMSEFNDKHSERVRKQNALDLAAKEFPTGVSYTPPAVQMGAGVTDPGTVIGGMESGGKYDAVGPVANSAGNRAYGKYQVMDFNVGPWTQEVLGKPMTPQEFVANPQAQDAVFKAKFGQYQQQFGSPDAAARAWFAGPGGVNNPGAKDVLGTSVADYSRRFNAGMGGPMVAQAGGPPLVPQGDAIRGQGDAPVSPGTSIEAPPKLVIPTQPVLTPADNARLRTMVFTEGPDKARAERQRILEVQQAQAKAEHAPAMEVWKQNQENRRFDRGQEAGEWSLLTPENAQMMLGPGYENGKAYMRNKKGEIKPVGGAQTVVNIDQKTEAEFGKEMGKMDAKRFGDIIEAERTMNDRASKLGFAMDQFRQTYTGPGAETAQKFNEILGAAGFTEAAKKATAAEAGMAVISEMKPAMRASGSGTSTDKDMDVFGKALPGLMNLPGGNEKVSAYFQRMADRATRVRELAQEHSDGGKVPLTRTGFDKAVRELGPLFTPDEVKQMQEVGKQKIPDPPAGFTVGKPGVSDFGRTPPPPAGFKVQ